MSRPGPHTAEVAAERAAARERVAAAVRLVRIEGWRAADAARHLDVGRRVLSRALRRAGVPPLPPGRPRTGERRGGLWGAP